MEELAVVVDPAHPRAGDELVAQDLAPDRVDLVALGEEPVAADVEAIPLVLVGPADPADQPGVGFEHHAGAAVLAQLVGSRQPRRTAAGNHRAMGGNDGLGRRIVPLRPAVRRQPRPCADSFRRRRLDVHVDLPSLEVRPVGGCLSLVWSPIPHDDDPVLSWAATAGRGALWHKTAERSSRREINTAGGWRYWADVWSWMIFHRPGSLRKITVNSPPGLVPSGIVRSPASPRQNGLRAERLDVER